jgi:DNA repair protein RecO (recombination protein O)
MYYKLQAFILKRQAYRDDDLLITVYSAEKGKLILQARGGKKIKSKLAGHLEPVNLSKLNIITGRHFDQLIGAALVRSHSHIKADYQKSWQALSFLSLVDGLTMEGHVDARIFDLIKKYLFFLENRSADYLMAQLAAGFKLLAILGFDLGAKPELKNRSAIAFIVKSDLKAILASSYLRQNIKALFADLKRQLEIIKNL